MPPGKDSLEAGRSEGTERWYGVASAPKWHRPRAEALAVALWTGTFAGRWASLPTHAVAAWWCALLVALLVRRNRFLWTVFVVLGVLGGARAWSAPAVSTGECRGTVRVVDDPRSFGVATSVVVDFGNTRVRAYGYGATGARLSRLSAGQRVRLGGSCGPVTANRRARELVAHVVGRMSVTAVGENVDDGGAVWRGANRVRALLLRGTRSMPDDDAALFAGLVIGDDRKQPRAMVDEFRASGLSHLCSVSGQNVVYVMAAFSVFLRKLRPAARLVATLVVIGWFVVLTRAEPSVLRAAAMASVVAVNFFRGRAANGRQVLAVSVIGLLLVDPMLAFSVGFALSTGATAGLAWLSRPLARGLRLPPVLAATVAAQLGTLPVSLLVFGRVSIVSLVANPVAVPVAGVVMLVGIPGALVAGIAPAILSVPIQWVMVVPTRFIAVVAHVSAGLAPHGAFAGACWVAVLVAARARWSVTRSSGRVGEWPPT